MNHGYEPPRLEVVGSLEQVTLGDQGNTCDGVATTNIGNSNSIHCRIS